MRQFRLTKTDQGARPAIMKMIAGMAGLLGLAGCITVTAPDRPIEINLNVNVKQEVIVKLQKDADNFINSNPELFPK